MTGRIRIVPHAESFEVRFPDGRESRFFYFQDEPIRRVIMGRMTKAEALEAAKAYAREEQEKLDGGGAVNAYRTDVAKPRGLSCKT